MNLFCFTLAGSTESLYEPARSQTLDEGLPTYQCRPAPLRWGPEWGDADPAVTSNELGLKRNSKRSCFPTSPSTSANSEKHIHHVCWTSPADLKDSTHHNKVPNSETCGARCRTREELNPDGTHTRPPAQGCESDAAESTHSRPGLKKLKSLVQVKKGHQPAADNDNPFADVFNDDNPVLTCISLRKRTEKSSRTAPSPQQQQQQQQQATDSADSQGDAIWSAGVGDDLCFHHTCHQPGQARRLCGATLSLPRTTEWSRFESLIQELDVKPPQMIRSITDLQLSQNTLTTCTHQMTTSGRFEAFTHHSPLTKPQDAGWGSKQHGTDDGGVRKLQEKHTEASSSSQRDMRQRALTAFSVCQSGVSHKPETQRRDAAGGQTFSKGGHREASLESLHSQNSGQSSSSGVTSGSECSSNRGSLRLDEDQFCGRARVHTDLVPGPYDTESLRLKVGDVIDIIAKPPMGIWTGMLNGRIGNFKFIYVDVLREGSPETHKKTQPNNVRHRSAVQEVLKQFSSPLQLNSYQTVEDLMKLDEDHLTELSGADPEHRHRLLANQEAGILNINTKTDMTNSSRDSGCPEFTAEDTDLHAPPPPAETMLS